MTPVVRSHASTRTRRSSAAIVGIALVTAVAVGCSNVEDTLPGTAEDQPVDDADDATPPDATAPDETAPTTSPDDGSDGDETTPDETTPDETTPDETAPGTTTPDDEPAATAPEVDEGPPTDDTADEQTPTDDDVDPVVVALAVAGFAVLLGIAAWWMVRRRDPDDDVGRPGRHDWPDTEMSI